MPPSLLPENPQWQNFPLSTYIPFWQYMWNTMVISALTILGVVVSSAFIAYGFARVRWPGRNLVFMVYLSTIMLPTQVTLIPLYIVFRQFGWVGTILPLVVPAFFGNALYVFLLRQFFMTIPNELTDAAATSTAPANWAFSRASCCRCSTALATVALFTFVATLSRLPRPAHLSDRSEPVDHLAGLADVQEYVRRSGS